MSKRLTKQECLAAIERADELIHYHAPRIAKADPEASDRHLRQVFAATAWLVRVTEVMVECYVDD